MFVRPINELEGLAPLRAAWNTLAGSIPFRRFEWLESWWWHYGHTDPKANAARASELMVLAVYDDRAASRPIGLAPWYVTAGRSRGRVVRFLGSGEVCSDYLGVLCTAGREAEMATALADWLSGPAGAAWDALDLTAIMADDPVVPRLVANLRGRGHACDERKGDFCWRLKLPHTWDEYLAGLSKSHRRQTRRAMRNLLGSGRARIRTAASSAELPAALTQLIDLHQRRRRSLGEPGCFSSPRFAAFLTDASARLFESGHLRLNWLEYEGRAVASDYLLVGGGSVFAYQGGLDPARLKLGPGRLLALAEIRQAIDEGRTAFDFLRGDERYKAHLRARPHVTFDYRVAASGIGPRLRHRLWLSQQHARHWARHGLQFAAHVGGIDSLPAGEPSG